MHVNPENATNIDWLILIVEMLSYIIKSVIHLKYSQNNWINSCSGFLEIIKMVTILQRNKFPIIQNIDTPKHL